MYVVKVERLIKETYFIEVGAYGPDMAMGVISHDLHLKQPNELNNLKVNTVVSTEVISAQTKDEFDETELLSIPLGI